MSEKNEKNYESILMMMFWNSPAQGGRPSRRERVRRSYKLQSSQCSPADMHHHQVLHHHHQHHLVLPRSPCPLPLWPWSPPCTSSPQSTFSGPLTSSLYSSGRSTIRGLTSLFLDCNFAIERKCNVFIKKSDRIPDWNKIAEPNCGKRYEAEVNAWEL